MSLVAAKGLYSGGKFVLGTAVKAGEIKQQVKSGISNGKKKVKQAVNKVEKAVKSKK